ncbi:sugar phosphorylase [Chelativorans sp. AA-79]|uniref:sugar phosphorylase n=1 Tax=Chelativorans sp. AA-79 TaxID=3028735 RepID=UPI0023F9CBC7|nr:sugar phosphorylase [Chelativorans sp. AA-79]WEX07229.1 sugar phosphorylase [Chelativorans sp. AA-79]
MKVRELLDRLKDAPPEAQVLVAEVDEAFAADIVAVDLIEHARRGSPGRGGETVELAEGSEEVIVIRW